MTEIRVNYFTDELVIDESCIISITLNEDGEYNIIARLNEHSVHVDAPSDMQRQQAIDVALDNLRVVATTERLKAGVRISDIETKAALDAADRIGDDGIPEIVAEAWSWGMVQRKGDTTSVAHVDPSTGHLVIRLSPALSPLSRRRPGKFMAARTSLCPTQLR